MSPIRLRVAELRKAKGWTQDALAQHAGVGRVTVNRIENAGNRRIDYDVLEKLADALEVEPGFLIVREPSRQAAKKSR
jgi:transcriptional regulator with XRE-family HTH domain